MLEQIKHNMESIAGIAIYPILSLLIFFLFFLARLLSLPLFKRLWATTSHMSLLLL